MGPHLSAIRPASRFPRILLADTSLSALESLIQSTRGERVEYDYEVCLSHDRAITKIFRSPPPYQCVISSISVAEANNFFLLRNVRLLQPHVPVLLTAGPAETASAGLALQEGAFDLLPTPFEPEETAHAIRMALWHNGLQTLIATREKAVEKYQQHLAAYPNDKKTEDAFRRALEVVQQTHSVVESSLQKMGEHFELCSQLVTSVEQHTRIRALDRLDRLRQQLASP